MRKQSKDNRSLFLPLDRHPKYQWVDKHIMKGENYVVRYREDLPIGFDIESKGLDPFNKDVFVISFAVSQGEQVFAYVVNHNGNSDSMAIAGLKGLVEDVKLSLIGHNIKFDLKWLAVKYGWDIKCNVFDTMMASYLLDENQEASLDSCMQRFLGTKSYKGMVNTADLESEHIDDVLLYNAKDAETESRLMRAQVPLLEKENLLPLMVIANQVFPILTKMEVRGVTLDRPYAKKTQDELMQQCVKDRITIANAGYGIVKPDSDNDLRHALYNVIGFKPTKYTDSGKASTDAEAISELYEQTCDPKVSNFLDSLVSYTKKMKLLTTYYQPIERWLAYDNRVHTSYSLGKQYDGGSGGTVTGRLSSTNPNLQNIPRGRSHRGMFIPTEGYSLIDGDFSQLELRVVAYLSQEPVMIESFQQGRDIHTSVMADIKGIDYDELCSIIGDDARNIPAQKQHPSYATYKEERVAIKRINFGIVYGVGASRLQRLIKNELNLVKSKEWCQDLIDTWLKKYTKVARWLEQQRQFATHTGYVIQPFHQKRRLPDAKLARDGFYKLDNTGRALASRALRQATNFPVQSTAAWICLIGMILIDQYFQDNPQIDGHLLMQVHDSVLCEVSNNYVWSYDYGYVVPNPLQDVAKDIQHIMEKQTLVFMKEFFGIDFNVNLSFPVKVLTRWE